MKRSYIQRKYTPPRSFAESLARKVAREAKRAAHGQQRPTHKGLGRGKGLTAKVDRKLIAWSKAVRERDDYTCQMTGIRDVQRNVAHHIAPRSLRPDLRLDINNGVTLTPEAHQKVHSNPVWARANGWLSTETYEKAKRAA